jgi:peroxiredoxin
MLEMAEMDENVTLAAQLEESCKHENFKAKSTVLFFYERNNPSR